MLIARPLSAVGGLLVLVLLSRKLSSPEYGIYFALWASAEILMLASNFGLLYAVYRYVNADERMDGKIFPRGPVWGLVGWRAVSLLLVAVGLALFPSLLHSLSDRSARTLSLIPLLAVVVFCEGMARFIEAIFDSMLCQSRSQSTLITRTWLRVLGIGYFVLHGSITIRQVVQVEVGATFIGASIALVLLLDIYRRARNYVDDEMAEFVSIRRMMQFALPVFASDLLGLIYGPDALKLALASVSGSSMLAIFGFAYALTAVIQRYMPAILLMGIFRPIFVATAKKPNGTALLSDLVGTIIKINWLMVLPIFAFMYFAGSPLLSILSHGNYAHAGPVVVILIGGLLPLAMNLTLLMYCMAREMSWPVLIATGVTTISLPIGTFLAKLYGASGMAVTFGGSELLWSGTCLVALHFFTKEALHPDWTGLGKMLGAGLFAIVACTPLVMLHMSWFMLAPLSALLFLLGVFFVSPFSSREKGWLLSVLPVGRFIKNTPQ